jgi:probable rRNA maturation factor
MNRVLISTEEEPPPRWGKSIKNYAQKVLAELGRDKWDLSIFLCGDRTISGLNSRYRGRAEATDVLSFSLDDGEQFPRNNCRRLPGDVVISLDTLSKNALRFNITENEELRRLLIHGILHLDGMDHKTNSKTERMLQLQEQILIKLKGEKI